MKFKFPRPSESYHSDGGWAWIVNIATGYCFGILIGMCNNYGLIYVEFERIYVGTENHVTYAGWIGSLAIGVEYIFCVLGSVLVDIFNPLKIGLLGAVISTASIIGCIFVSNMKLYFLTYGFLFGFGQALLLAATLSILPYYFEKKLSLANGLMNFIGSIIIILLPIVTSAIINSSGLKMTFLMLAAVNAVGILAVFTYVTPEKSKDESNSFLKVIKKSLGTEIFKRKKFILWCVSTFIGKFGYLIPIINIDHHGKLAFPDKEPMIINVVFSTLAAIAGIIFGKLGDWTAGKIPHVHYHTIVYLFYGITQFCIPLSNIYWVFMVEIVILGIFDGILLSFIVPIAFSLAGCHKLANQAIGYYHITMSVTAIAGPTVAGKIFEIYKSYDNAFYLGGLTSFVAGALLLFGTTLIDCFKLDENASRVHNENQDKTVDTLKI